MAFLKTATISLDHVPVQALNKPESWTIFNMDNIKVAQTTKDSDLGGFDLNTAVTKYPDHLFVKIFAIKKDEPNDNGDSFSAEQLRLASPTFTGVPIFTNHQNDDVEKAKGDVVHSWYDEAAGGIFIIARVDKVAYPKLARGIEEGYIVGCFPGDAPVLMSDGTEKNICDIEDGDYVISGRGNIRKVLGIRQRGYSYPMLSIQAQGIKQPLVCTSYHNLFVYRLPNICACGCGEELPEKKDSRITVKTFQRRFVKGHNTRGEKIQHQYIQKIKANEIQEGDFLIEPRYLCEKEKEYITDGQAFLIGLFLAEGSYDKRQGKRNGVIFNFSHNERDTLAFKCEELLSQEFPTSNKPTVNFYPEASQTRVSLYGKEIAQWFYDKCGEYSDKKKLNQRLMDLTTDQTSSLIAGFMEGDGYNVKSKSYGFGIVSAGLASQLRILLSKIGIRTGYRIRKNTGTWGYKPVHEVIFGLTTSQALREKLIYKQAKINEVGPARWHSTKDIVLRPVKKIEEVDFNGTVYDIEVEEDHSYCVNHLAVSNTSMGCSVEYSICSVCHRKAHNQSEYCSHIKNQKNRKVSGAYKCEYHKSGVSDLDETCPICGSTKDDVKSFKLSDYPVFEHNYGLKFVENSFVVNPACHTCGVTCILHVPEVTKKLGQLRQSIEKLSEKIQTDDTQMKKTAGVKELQLLKQSMDDLEKVAKSMFAQKDQVSVEYISDIVKIIAQIQESTDELMEMGYGNLVSPNVLEGASPAPMQPVSTFPKAPAPITPSPEAAGSSQVQDLGGMGTMTLPKISSNKIKDFSGGHANIQRKVSEIVDSVKRLARSKKMITKSFTALENPNDPNSRQAIIAHAEDGVSVTIARGDTILKYAHISQFPENIQKLIREKPEEAFIEIFKENFVKENNGPMTTDNTLKTAAGKENLDIITEKQLMKQDIDLHPRTGETYKGITESNEQIGKGKEDVNDTTSSSPQVRQGTYDVITEGQLATAVDDCIIRFNNTPDVITEKQWTETSRAVGAKVSEDYTKVITEAQLRDLLSNHSFVTPDVITEGQLKADKRPSGIKRWAMAEYPKTLIKIAEKAIAETIAKYHKSPDEIRKVLASLEDNKNAKDKFVYLALINALPHKREDLTRIAAKVAYFTKLASKDVEPTTVDSLIFSIAANAETGLKAEDVIDAVSTVIRNKTAMARVDAKVKEIIDGMSVAVGMDNVVDKRAAFEQAISDLEKPEDGRYQIRATLEDLGIKKAADIQSNKGKFIASVNKFAQEQIEGEIGTPVATVTMDIKVYDDGTVIIDAKEAGEGDEGVGEDDLDFGGEPEVGPEATGDELEGPVEDIVNMDGQPEGPGEKPCSFASRDAVVKKAAAMNKTAQFGGEFGGQGGLGSGPGAGATMPQAPGAAAQQPPVESFNLPEDEGMGGDDDTMEPAPPGTICPVCGTDDVDVVAGRGKCNNEECGAEFVYKVHIDVTKWPGMIPETKEQGAEEGGEVGAGEGFEMPGAGGAPGGAPGAAGGGADMGGMGGGGMSQVAAMTLITPKMMQKLAEKKVKLGTISPATGKANTLEVGKNEYICLDTGTKYKVEFATDREGKRIYAQWSWQPRVASLDCPSCQRAKESFIQSLAKVNVTQQAFDAMDVIEKTKVINQMRQAGALAMVKTAAKTGNIIGDYKVAYGGYGEKFPMEACREKLARRYGEDALAISGPCEGQKLIDCVCQQLKNAGVYTTKIALKVADAWSDKSGSEECIEDRVREGMGLNQAATVCEFLKVALAGPDDMFADELGTATTSDMPEGPGGPGGAPIEEAPPTDGIGQDDPFDGGEMITIELPKDIAVQVSEAVEKATGEGAISPEATPAEGAPVEGAPADAVPMEAPAETPPVEGTPAEATKPVEMTPPMDSVSQGNANGDGSMKSVIEPTAAPAGAAQMGGETKKPAAEPGKGVTVEIKPTGGDAAPVDPVTPDETPAHENAETPVQEKSEEKEEKEEGEIGGESEQKENEPKDENESFKEGDDDEEEGYGFAEASVMNSSFGKVNKISLDLSKVQAVINKSAQSATVDVKKVQDTKEIGSYTGGENAGAIGKENPPKSAKPDVPRSQATIGKEPSDLNPKDKPLPEIPSGSAEIGKEKELGFTGGDHSMTGGDKGQGKTDTAMTAEEMQKEAELDEVASMRGIHSTRSRIDSLVNRIKAAQKKINDAKPVADDKDIQPVQNGSTIGKEPKFDAKGPENTKSEGTYIGHEKEVVGDKPDAPKDQPSIPADKQLIGQEGEQIAPEKQENIKGTVIANESSDTKQSEAEAFRVAGRMVEAGLIEPKELKTKVDQLKSYKPAQIADYEKIVFASKKGLDTVSEGVSQPVIINANSSVSDANQTLAEKLSSMMTLGRQNAEADKLPDASLKRTFRK